MHHEPIEQRQMKHSQSHFVWQVQTGVEYHLEIIYLIIWIREYLAAKEDNPDIDALKAPYISTIEIYQASKTF